MKKRYLIKNRKAVSNVLGYLLSILILSMLTVSSMLITNSYVNDKTNDIAGVEAQHIANKIAYCIQEAITKSESNANSYYEKTVSVPMSLAGLSYYFYVSEGGTVYVKTTNGQVSKTSSFAKTSNTNILSVGSSYYPDDGDIKIKVSEPDYLYKFDFGVGDIESHSPVKEGYYMVSDKSQNWDNVNFNTYKKRIPIKITKDGDYALTNVAVKITLDTSNFDYDAATVNDISETNIRSDLVFYDSTEAVNNERPYFIDQWNPNGESLIYVLLNMGQADPEKIIYLYFDEKNDQVDDHYFYDLTPNTDPDCFYDDFDGVLAAKWTWTGDPSTTGNILTLDDDDSVTTDTYSMSGPNDPADPPDDSVTNEYTMYIVESKVKITTSSNSRFRQNLLYDIVAGSYNFEFSHNPGGNLRLGKTGAPESVIKSIPVLSDWQRLKTYIFSSKTKYNSGGTSDVTSISSYLYNYNTFGFNGKLSGLDTTDSAGSSDDQFTNDPLMSGKIRLMGSDLGGGGDVEVDWIRVMKIPPFPLTIDFGPCEINRINDDSFYYPDYTGLSGVQRQESIDEVIDPVLVDYHTSSNPKTFTIENLPAGDYTISVTSGDYTDSSDETVVSINSNPIMTIPLFPLSVVAGEFNTGHYVLKDWAGGDLGLQFSSSGDWKVNSVNIQNGEKGIEIS